ADYLLLEGLVVSNNNLNGLGHTFYVYNIGSLNNIMINQKFIFNKFKNKSDTKTTGSYKNHLEKLLKEYSLKRSQLRIPTEADFYVDCCYVEPDYVMKNL